MSIELEANFADQLILATEQATDELIIVAPFIKVNALHRLIERADLSKLKVHCITRWNAYDIVAGVCDLEIFDVFERISNATLWKNGRLHAKYFRCDNSCFVGSANVTGSGMGWSDNPSIELLLDVSEKYEQLIRWENALLRSCMKVTSEVKDSIAREVEELRQGADPVRFVEVEVESSIGYYWLPLSTDPEILYQVYSRARMAENTVSSALESAESDLHDLRIPEGLSQEKFRSFVKDRLRQVKVFCDIIGESERSNGVPITQSYIEAVIGQQGDRFNGERVKAAPETVFGWVEYFFADQFQVRHGEPFLVRARRLR